MILLLMFCPSGAFKSILCTALILVNFSKLYPNGRVVDRPRADSLTGIAERDEHVSACECRLPHEFTTCCLASPTRPHLRIASPLVGASHALTCYARLTLSRYIDWRTGFGVEEMKYRKSSITPPPPPPRGNITNLRP